MTNGINCHREPRSGVAISTNGCASQPQTDGPLTGCASQRTIDPISTFEGQTNNEVCRDTGRYEDTLADQGFPVSLLHMESEKMIGEVIRVEELEMLGFAKGAQPNLRFYDALYDRNPH